LYGASADGFSTNPSLSSDGSLVAFESKADNLAVSPPNPSGAGNVYVANLTTGATTLVTQNAAGTASASSPGDDPLDPQISGNGEFVVFVSDASNLIPGMTIFNENVYVRNLLTGTTTLVSEDAAGDGPGHGYANQPSISANGQYVAFVSSATDLVPGMTVSSIYDNVYVRDMTTGVTQLVSRDLAGTDGGNGTSSDPVISSDGQYVAFLTQATDLTQLPTSAVNNLMVRDVLSSAPTTTLVSVNSAGTAGSAKSARDPVFSPDDSQIAFASTGTDLVSTPTGGVSQIYIRNLKTATTTLASVNQSGTAANGSCYEPSFNSDGAQLAFLSSAGNLASGAPSGQLKLFVHDLSASTNTLLNLNAGSALGNETDSNGFTDSLVHTYAISPDFSKVAFISANSSLVPNDNDGWQNVFVQNVATGSVRLVSQRAPSLPEAFAAHGPNQLNSTDPDGAISTNGQFVAFDGGGADLAGTNPALSNVGIVVVRDVQTGALIPLEGSLGSQTDSSEHPVLSADGSIAAFDDSNLATGDLDYPDVYYVNGVNSGTPSSPILVSASTSGLGQANGPSDSPVLSANGQVVIFESLATDLLPGSVKTDNSTEDLFAYDIATKTLSLVSVNQSGTAAGIVSGEGGPVTYGISADGRDVVFESSANDIVPGITNHVVNVYVRDLTKNTTTLVSADANGNGGGDRSSSDAIESADGSSIIYTSTADNLVQNGPPLGSSHVFLYNIANQTTTLVSLNSSGAAIEGQQPASSGNGQVIAFVSAESTPAEVYAYSVATGTSELVSVNSTGTAADQSATQPIVSSDGRFVAFLSGADNLAPGSFNPQIENLYLRDLKQAATTLVSANIAGTGGGDTYNGGVGVTSAAFSGDDSTLVFTSTQYDLIAVDGSNQPELFAYAVNTGSGPGKWSISGEAFNDLTGSGQLKTGDPGLPGWTVYLDTTGAGHFVAGDPTTTTDAHGNYSFTGLATGKYTVGEILQGGYQETDPAAPGTYAVTLAAGQTVTGEDFGDEAVSPDLAIQSIVLPDSGQSGQPANISYTVVNKGSAAAAGDWSDAVYLSQSTSLDASATLVGIFPHTGGLGVGQTYTVSLDQVPLPELAPGSYDLIVRLDRRGQVAESAAALADETDVSSTNIALAVPTLTIGTPVTSSFTAAGQDRYFQVDVAAGGSLVLTLQSAAASGSLDLAVRFDAAPASGSNDADSIGTFAPNQRIDISPTQSGTYYIDVHSQEGAAATSSFTLTATTPGLSILGVSPQVVGAGSVTIGIQGTMFTRDTTFAVVAASGAVGANAVSFESGSEVFATFNLTGVPSGTYGITATVPGGAATTFGSAVPVQPATMVTIATQLLIPSRARADRVSAMEITYTNTGNTDQVAPLLQIESPSLTPMGLAPDALDTPNNAQYTVQVMATSRNGPAGILSPGQQGDVFVYFQALNNRHAQNLFTVSTNTATDPIPVDYSELSSSLRPSGYTDSQWNAIYANFQQQVGPTSGDYVAMLARNATLLPASVGNVQDPALDVDLEIQRAIAAVGTSITGTIQSTDPSVSLADRSVIATNETTGDIFSAQTLNDGSFILGSVAPGTYQFQVEGAIVQGTPTAQVATNQAVTGVNLSVALGGVIHGQIASGAPGVSLSSATVTAIASDGTPYQGSVATDGLYTISGLPPDTYTVEAKADGLAAADVSGITSNDDVQVTNLSLTAQSVITGTVTLQAGGPTGNPLVIVAQPSGSTDPNALFFGTITGSNFTIDNLPAGTYDVTLIENGYVTQTISAIAVAAGGSASAGTIQLATAASVSGTLTSSDQQFSAAYELVGAFAGSTLVAATVTDSSGAFSVTGLPPGTYQFGVAGTSDPASSPSVTVTAGQARSGIVVTVDPSPGSKAALIRAFQQLPTNDQLRELLHSFLNDAEDVFQSAKSKGQKSEQELSELPSPCPGCEDQYTAAQTALQKAIRTDLAAAEKAVDLENAIVANADRKYASTDGLLMVTRSYIDPLLRQMNATTGDAAQANAEAGQAVRAYQTAHDLKCPPPNPPQPPPQQPAQSASSASSSGQDPNEKVTGGFGTQSFVAPRAAIPYEVYFENDPKTATAAVQEVTVTDPLSTSLDWNTFALGTITFGSTIINVTAGLQSFSTTVDTTNTDGTPLVVDVSAGINPAMGVVTWTFRSVDPATGQLPGGVDDGFLPIDDATGRGLGSVSFEVSPAAGLKTGTTIKNTATIVFDTNAPIPTDTTTTTIDATSPTSSVNPMPATSTSKSFTVSWKGSDGAGSGIASYNIYVSDNGRPYQPFLTGTTQTSATFTKGQVDHTYRFYSVATSNVGLSQPNQVTAQATTTVVVTMSKAVLVLNSKHQVTEIVVSFSGPVNAALADRTGTYRLATAGKGGPSNAKNAGVIKLNKAVYSTASDSVTLTPQKPFSLAKTVQLVVSGTPPAGLQDASGRFINGGKNAVAVLSSGGATIAAAISQPADTRTAVKAQVVDALLERNDLTAVSDARRAAGHVFDEEKTANDSGENPS